MLLLFMKIKIVFYGNNETFNMVRKEIYRVKSLNEKKNVIIALIKEYDIQTVDEI